MDRGRTPRTFAAAERACAEGRVREALAPLAELSTTTPPALRGAIAGRLRSVRDSSGGRDHGLAALALAAVELEGRDVPRNRRDAIAVARRLRGDASTEVSLEARRLCGLDALGRFGGPAKRVEAASLLRSAALHGSPEAACDLAETVTSGEVDGSPAEAEAMHRVAAGAGIARSALLLARIVATRPGEEDESLTLLDEAALADLVEAEDAAAAIRAGNAVYASRRGAALEAAARVAAGLGLPRRDARSIASRLIGYDSWDALERGLSEGACEPPDESCAAAEVVARRARQSALLEEVLGLHPSLAHERVDAIRPTARSGRATRLAGRGEVGAAS